MRPAGSSSRYATLLVGLLIIVAWAGIAGAVPVALPPVADAYVYQPQPDANFGSDAALRTDSSPLLRSFLRFNVQGFAPGQTVTLRALAQTANGQGIDLHTVADTGWAESAIFNSAPPIGAVIGSSGPISAGTWLTFDVTGQVSGDGPVSFALTSPSNTATRFSSREGAAPPELVLDGPASSSSPYLVTRAASTYTAQSQTNGTTFSGSLKLAVEAAVADLQTFGGGEVIFGADTYAFGSDHFEFTGVTDVSFSGAGMGLTVLQNVSSAAADTEPFDFHASDRIVIRDMTVSAGGPVRNTSDALDFDGGDDVLIERVQVVQSRGRGIVFDGKDAIAVSGGTALRNVVRDCVISGVPRSGIELLAASQNRVENCTITDVGGNGIHVNKASPGAAQPNKISDDNLIAGNVITTAGLNGILLTGGDNNQILTNTITNSADDASGRDGVRITSGDGVSCASNLVQDNAAGDDQPLKTQRYGLAIVHSLCTGNVVGDNDFTGNLSGPLLDQGTATLYTDTSPPTAPGSLQATSVTASSVTLSWASSTDNYFVEGYTISRDGSPVGTTAAQTLTFADASVAPATSYTYTVTAVDAATNTSPPSNPVAVSTSGGGGGAILPLRAAFYYPWFPEAWEQGGRVPVHQLRPQCGPLRTPGTRPSSPNTSPPCSTAASTLASLPGGGWGTTPMRASPPSSPPPSAATSAGRSTTNRKGRETPASRSSRPISATSAIRSPATRTSFASTAGSLCSSGPIRRTAVAWPTAGARPTRRTSTPPWSSRSSPAIGTAPRSWRAGISTGPHPRPLRWTHPRSRSRPGSGSRARRRPGWSGTSAAGARTSGR